MNGRAVDPRLLRESHPLRGRLDVHQTARSATLVARAEHFGSGPSGAEPLSTLAAIRWVRAWLATPRAGGVLADFLHRNRMTGGLDVSRVTVHELTELATRLLEARRITVFEHLRITVKPPSFVKDIEALGPLAEESGWYLNEDVDEPPGIAIVDDVDSQPTLALVDDVEEAPAIHLVDDVDSEEAPLDDELAALDLGAQAQAMLEASRGGMAFCEECEKAKQAAAAAEADAAGEDDDVAALDVAAQALTMTTASSKGVPFCEECEKAKAREALGG